MIKDKKLDEKLADPRHQHGSNRVPPYTGEGKGGPDPSEEEAVFQTSLPLLILISPILHPTTKEYSDIHIIYTGMKKHQIKSGYYYIFWGLATVSVVLGQIYVGSGYRLMTESIEEVTKEISKAFD